MNRNISFNLLGGGEINIPSRSISGFYKDDITGEVILEVCDEEYRLRDSIDEVKYLLGLAT